MTRNELIRDLWNIQSPIKQTQLSKLLRSIGDNQLIDFANYCAERKSNSYETLDQMICRCKDEYLSEKLIFAIRANKFRFANIDEMHEFLKKHFRGKDICNGDGVGYAKFVIIAMNNESELVNRYRLNEYNKPKRLDGEEVIIFLNGLFENQAKIGTARELSLSEFKQAQQEFNDKYEQLEQKRNENLLCDLRKSKNNQALNMISNVAKILTVFKGERK